MRLHLRGLLAVFASVLIPAFVHADDPVDLSRNEPSNDAVLLPPQAFEGYGKGPNHERERGGEWSIYAGVFLWQPVFETNPAFVVATGNGVRQVDFSHNLEAAPNIWLAYVSERGWGVRARWYQFDHDSTASYATGPGETVSGVSLFGPAPVGGTVLASSHLAVNVADFQVTCTYESAKWLHLCGIGVRYTHLSQDYRATSSSAANLIDVSSGHGFNAGGPSFSFETKRRLGEGGFWLYGQLHGAILFGHAHENYASINNGIVQELTRSQTDVVPVGEMEIGAEYQKDMGRARLFVQAGFSGQVWWGGGNASNLDPVGPSSATNYNFGFLGLSLRAGVRY